MRNREFIKDVHDFRNGRKYEVALIALRLLGSKAANHNPDGLAELINEIVQHVESEGYKLRDFAEVITALSEELDD